MTTLAAITSALSAAGFELPHVRASGLRGPFRLHEGELALPELAMRTGTLVVIGALRVAGALELQRDSRPLAHVIVVGSCALGRAYVDGFLVVRDDLDVQTLVADAAWDGGVFVGGTLAADTLVVHNTQLTLKGATRARVTADTAQREAAREALPSLFVDDDPEPRAYFDAITQPPR
ncbi:MAG TPA: hypothetical protein VGL61_22135 [Kofleriaceae bacterium]